MKTHYLILKKPVSTEGSPYELAGPDGSDSAGLLGVAEFAVHDSNGPENSPADSETQYAIPRMPYELIEPVSMSESVSGSENSEWIFGAIGATGATGGEGITVAVIDTGIDATHEAFHGVTLQLCDFTHDRNGVEGKAPDQHGHGTHCAGTLFGRDVQGVRIGVARGIKKALIGKVLNGGPYSGTTEAIYSAIEWALKEGADIISMSLAIEYPKMVARLQSVEHLPEAAAVSTALDGYRRNLRLFDALARLLEARDADGKGVVVIAAAGNHSRRERTVEIPIPYTVIAAPPATADGFLSIAAIQRIEVETDKYEYGVPYFSNTGARLAAPGWDVWSAQRGVGLASMSGTSMATPIVAGVAALWGQSLLNQNGGKPRNWARSVVSKLEGHAKVLPGLSRDDVGEGLVQAP